MKLPELLTICAQLVKAWPQKVVEGEPMNSLRPNTFAFIDDEMEFESNTMGKDARYGPNTPYFFSRTYSGSGYNPESLIKEMPAILCYTQSGKIIERKGLEEVKMNFVVQDEYIRTIASRNRPMATKEEIHDTVRDIRDVFITGLLSMIKNEQLGEYRPKSWLIANGYSTSGEALASIVKVQESDISVTFPQDPGGGLIHSYFGITFYADMCRTVSGPWEY